MNNLLAINSAEELLDYIWDWCSTAGVKIVMAIVMLIVGFALVNVIVGWIKKINDRRGFDKTIAKTLQKTISYALKTLIVVALLAYLGVETSGVTALITSLGVTLGLALQGALSNVAGGILIIVARPFALDDYIEAQGVSGTVEDIRLLYTKVRTLDNKVISLPNGTLANGTIINYTAKTTRRVDIDFGISYTDDFKAAQSVVLSVAAKNEKVLKDPAPICRVSGHGESSVVLSFKGWTRTEDYWEVYFSMFEGVKSAFDEAGISIPFNQLDVHIKNEEKGE